jgi:hypothetical protein
MATLLLTKGFHWSVDSVKLALLNSGYGPNFDTDDQFADCSAFEITGTGYTAGGVALTTKTLNYQSATNKTELKADNVTWSGATITARYAVLYAAITGNPLLSLVDFESNVSVPSGTFSVQWTGGVVMTLETGSA